jgi:hypothetical protein
MLGRGYGMTSGCAAPAARADTRLGPAANQRLRTRDDYVA